MSDATVAEAGPPAKSGKKGMMIGGVLALVLGGGAFYATWSGLLFGSGDPAVEEAADTSGAAGLSGNSGQNITFVPLDPLVISLAPGANARHLRFSAELEVPRGARSDVERLKPRVVDVINSYLRAVDPVELSEPGALIRLRAQLLRRIELVVGPEQVEDLLIMEFVLD